MTTSQIKSLFLFNLFVVLSLFIPLSAIATPEIAEVYGGRSVTGQATRFPLIISQVSATKGWLCSGTFITKRKILTAKHCVQPTNTSAKVTVKIFQGHSFIKARSVKKASFDDIAIINVPLVNDASPLPIKLSNAPSSGEILEVFGYGLDEEQEDGYERSLNAGKLSIQKLQSALKEATVGINTVVLARAPGYARSSLYVYVSNNGDGKPCQGDSGGGAILNASGVDQLIGVLSFGEVPVSGPVCVAQGISAYLSLHSSRVKNFLLANAKDAKRT